MIPKSKQQKIQMMIPISTNPMLQGSIPMTRHQKAAQEGRNCRWTNRYPNLFAKLQAISIAPQMFQNAIFHLVTAPTNNLVMMPLAPQITPINISRMRVWRQLIPTSQTQVCNVGLWFFSSNCKSAGSQTRTKVWVFDVAHIPQKSVHESISKIDL